MGATSERLDERLSAWLCEQPVFFVATAPGDGNGHVNVSPKGLRGSFAVIDPTTVAYLDLVGSGAETIAHLRENGRITLMFCALDGAPRIVRLYGSGRVVLPGEREFEGFTNRFESGSVADLVPDARSVIVVRLDLIADSCGFGVPRMELLEERRQLPAWAEGKKRKGGPDALERFIAERNRESIDGLPAIDPVN